MIAQQPTGPATAESAAPEVVFRATTSLVQVGAVVTDSKGHYITDLTADDFEVFEDGKPQKITNFSYVQVSPKPGGVAEPVSPRKSGPHLPPPPAAPLRPEDVRRTIVLMVDDLGLRFEDMAWVRSSLHKFVENQIQPGDLVAVCRTGAGSGALQQFTNDKRILLAAVDALGWNPNTRKSVLEPLGQFSDAAGNPINSLDPQYDAYHTVIMTMGTLGAMYNVIGALQDMPGRKSVVLFSEGINLSNPAENGRGFAELQDAMRKLVDRANRAGTVFYTMQATGLVNPTAPGADERIGLGQLAAATQVGAVGGRDVEFNAEQQGLAEIALNTGGLVYENGNDLNWGLNRVLEDQQGYYLIGYKPSTATFEDRNGYRSYHHVTVKVTRAGLHVRSAEGFFGATDDEARAKSETPLERLHAAMISPFQSSGVRLRLTSLYAEVPNRGAVVRNLLHIATEDLKYATLGDSAIAHTEIVAVATDADGQVVGSFAQGYQFRTPAERLPESVKEGALYTIDVAVRRRGPFQIHVAVRDSATGKVGSASQFLEIPDLKKDRVALTSVVLQDGKQLPGSSPYAGMTPATRQFQSGGEVEYFCVVEKAGKGRSSGEDVDAQIRVVHDGKDVFTGPARLVAMDDGRVAIAGALKLDKRMAPGDYYLGIIAGVRGAPKNAPGVQWTDFEILP